MLTLTHTTHLPHPGPQRFVVDKLLPTNKLVSLYGEGGLGKSLLAQFLGSCVINGQDCFNLKTTKGHVIYLDGEDDLDTYNRRFKAISQGHHFPRDPAYFRMTSPVTQNFLQELQETITYYNTILLIADSYSAISGGDMDYSSVITIMNSFRSLNTTVLFLDHEPKYNETQVGPGAKRNQVRGQFHLEEWRDSQGKLLKLTRTKENTGGNFQPLYIKITSFPDTQNPISTRFEQVFPTPGTHSSPKDLILNAIRKLGIANLQDIAQETGLQGNSLGSALSRLVKDGRVLSDGKKPATYTLP